MTEMPDVYRLSTVPDRDAYVFALSQPFVKPHHMRILLANRNAPDAACGVEALARAVGAIRHSHINLHYGVLAHKVADLLDLRVPTYSPESSRPLWTTALAQGGRESPEHIWIWRMYPEVCAAIDQLGWAQP